MRVLIDYRPALRERSGVGEYTHQLAVALLQRCAAEGTRAPMHLTLFSSSWKDRLIPDGHLRAATIVDRRVPVAALNYAWHRLEWPPVEWLGAGAVDVVHSMHQLLMPSTHAAQVVTIHDLNFLSHPERTRAEVRRDYPALAGAHARRADAVVVVSRFTASEVQTRLGVAAERITICSPGAPPWMPREAGWRPDDYVLFFGTLEPRKNVGALLDAYEQLARQRASLPRLLLAGKATGQSGPWLERIARPPLDRYVTHIGYVNPAERRALYERARVLVQPSFEEGFGLPVLEAMTMGVPVVAANRGALPEVLGDAGLLIDPEQPDALASAIARLLEDDAFAAACVDRGFARAAMYTWDATARQAYTAYESAMARRAGRSSH